MASLLEAPSLAGSRRRAQEILAGLPDSLAGGEVILSCRGLLAAAISFADELVNQILVVRGAARLTVVDLTDDEFGEYLRDRAEIHGVSDRIYFS